MGTHECKGELYGAVRCGANLWRRALGRDQGRRRHRWHPPQPCAPPHHCPTRTPCPSPHPLQQHSHTRTTNVRQGQGAWVPRLTAQQVAHWEKDGVGHHQITTRKGAARAQRRSDACACIDATRATAPLAPHSRVCVEGVGEGRGRRGEGDTWSKDTQDNAPSCATRTRDTNASGGVWNTEARVEMLASSTSSRWGSITFVSSEMTGLSASTTA